MKWENPDLSDEDIITALKNAQAYEFVSKLPMGLDSHVEQGGKNFSGGQRQRLCIARAIAAQPKVLILDDSFSALDFATDAALRKALSQYTHEMTVIIVTQRCSTIMNSDLILVLDDGMLVGKGTHKELLKTAKPTRKSAFHSLANRRWKFEKSVVRRVLKYIKPYKGLLALAILSAIISVSLTLYIPVLTGNAIDNIIDKGNVNFENVLQIIIYIAVGVAGVAIFSGL